MKRLAYDAAVALIVAVAGFVAALPALQAYRAGGAAGLLVVAAIGPVVIAFGAGRLLRWPAPASYGLSLAGLVVLLLAAGRFRIGVTYRDLIDGPNRVLTETLPLGGGMAALSALLVITWLAGAIAGELLARARTDRPAPPLPLAMPVLLFVLCYGVAVSAPHRDNRAGFLLLLLLAGAAVLRNFGATVTSQESAAADEESRAGRRYRPVAVGMVAAVAATAGLWGLAPRVPALTGRPAAVHRAPPTSEPTVTDPVDAMAQLRDSNPGAPPQPLLQVNISGRSTGYLDLAVLDAYDGDLWQFGATFQPTGGRVPGTTSLISSQDVTQRVAELGPLPLPMLAALDRPVFVSGLAVAADPSTGMLIPDSGRPHPASYTVVSQTGGVTLADLPPADGVGAGSGPADGSLPQDAAPDVATTARFLATLTGQRPAPTLSFLDAAVSAIRTNDRRIDPSLAGPRTGTPHLGGTSLSEVIHAVTVNRAATPEQFATFLSMVARYLGVPARVVTGFRIGSSPDGKAVAPGRYQVTNRQAWTWVEIPVAGFGWVVVDPTPNQVTGVAAPPPEAVQAPSTTLPPRQANAVPRASILGGHALAPKSRVRIPVTHHLPVWADVLIGIGGAVVLLLLVGPGQAGLRRWWRRRSRRSPDPAELAVGAWLELLDGLGRAGLRPEPGSTSREVAAEAAGCFGPELTEPVGRVGAVAERAVFSLSAPPDAVAAHEVWQVQRSVCRQVRRGLPPGERIRSSLLVGSTPRRPAAQE